MIKTYMKVFYPGTIMSEIISKPVADRTIPEDPPPGSYAIQFYDIKEIEISGEILQGKIQKNLSPIYYWGEKFTDKEALEHPDCNRIMAANIIDNKITSMVRTITNRWFSLSDNDVVINRKSHF